MKGKGEVKGWITVHGVHVPIYENYTVRGGTEPKAKGSRFKSNKRSKKPVTKAEGKGAVKDVTGKKERNVLGQEVDFAEVDRTAKEREKDFIVNTKIPDNPKSIAKAERQRIAREAADEADDYDRQHKEGKYANRDFSSELANAHKAGYSAQSEEGKPSVDFSKMKYSEAGAYVAAHKKDFGLNDDDDAYLAAYEMKKGTWKGKMPEQESNTVNRGITNKTTPEDYAKSQGKTMHQMADEVLMNPDAHMTARQLMQDGRSYNEAAALAYQSHLEKKSSSTPTIHETRLQRQAVNEKAGLKTDKDQVFKNAYQNSASNEAPDFSKMSYSEAGAYVAAHKKDFGLNANDDAYMAAYEMKQDTWKKPENSTTESPKLNTKENYRAVKQANTGVDSKLTAEEQRYKKENAEVSKADAYNDQVLADFKSSGRDIKHISSTDYAGTITDFKVAAKRAGIDAEYDSGSDSFTLRQSVTPKESNAGSRYKTKNTEEKTSKLGYDSDPNVFASRKEARDLNLGLRDYNKFKAKDFGSMSLTGLKEAFANASGGDKAKIKAALQAKGYVFKGGKWIKG